MSRPEAHHKPKQTQRPSQNQEPRPCRLAGTQRLEINGALEFECDPTLASRYNVHSLDSVFMLMYLDFAAGFEEGQQIKDFLFREAVDQTDGHGGGVLPRALFDVAFV